MRTAAGLLLAFGLFGGGPEDVISRLDDSGRTPAWRWLTVGMTRSQVEDALGERLILSDIPDNDQGCQQYGTYARIRGQQVYLDFEGTGRSAQLISFTLILKDPRESLDLGELRDAVKASLPRAVYRPPASAPETKERDDPRPTYALGKEGMELRITPGLGVAVGRLCGD